MPQGPGVFVGQPSFVTFLLHLSGVQCRKGPVCVFGDLCFLRHPVVQRRERKKSREKWAEWVVYDFGRWPGQRPGCFRVFFLFERDLKVFLPDTAPSRGRPPSSML